MCGIAGIVRFDGAPADPRALRRMAAALAHRGPDGEGFHIAGPVGLAHRRLAIIDPVGGRQPLIDRESGLAITYNGEVYNYTEIRRELGERDLVTSSDTEVVLRAWRRWGAAAVDRFRGMFAFALHDPGLNKVFLVRDRVGIKPLYYRVGASAVCFASEIGALLASEICSPDVDETSVSLFLRLGYVPTPRTIYRGIHKLEPGSILSIDIAAGAIGRQRYWRGEAAIRPRPEAEALAELDALLTDTMRLYVRSDVPFGAFLSGGVDSSLVTALMAEVVGEPVRSFSIGFAEATHSELPFAQEAAERLGTRHRGAVLDPELSISLLQRLAGRFGEPFGDSSCLPTWYVSRLAGGELKMVLSGDGGDELFAGYESYPAVYSASGGGRGGGTRAAFANFARAAAGFARHPFPRHPFQRSWIPEHHRRRDTFSPSERALLTGRAAAPLPDEDIAEPSTADPVTRCQLRDLGSYLLDDILVKVDRMSMDNSLEVRVPLLDHKLIEFAFSLPLDLRLRQVGDSLVGKYLLKRAAERFFPRSFLDRPKRGFGIPIQSWLKGPLQPIVRDLLEAGADQLAPLLDPGSVRRVVRGFYSGQDEAPEKVWALLSFRLWLDTSRAGTGARAVETTA